MLAIEYVRRNMSRKGWVFFLLGELFFLIELALNFFIPLVQKRLIDSAMSNMSGRLNETSVLLLIVAFGLSLSLLVSARFNGYANGESVKDLSIRTFERVYGHRYPDILKKGVSWYRIMVLGQNLSVSLCSAYSMAIFSVVQFVAVLIIISKWNSTLSYIIIGIDFVYGVFLILFANFEKKYSESYLRGNLKSGSIVQGDFDTVKMLHRFGKTEKTTSYLCGQIDEFASFIAKRQAVSSAGNYIYEVITLLTMLSLVTVCLSSLKQGSISTSSLVTIVSYIPQVLMPCKAIGSVLDLEAYEKPLKMRYIDLQKQYEDSIPATFSMPEMSSVETMILRDIGFSYTENVKAGEEADKGKALRDSATDDVLDNAVAVPEVHISGISLTCAEGSSTALLGLSGEGKSTIIKLMTGEESPAAGEVLFCGVPIASLPVPVQYAFINAYSQETEILDDDALGNILVGKEMIAAADVEAAKEKLSAQFSESLSALRGLRCRREGQGRKKTTERAF